MKPPEFDLYNCKEYIGDIWKGANYLSNLPDKKLIKTIKDNLACRGELSKIRKFNRNVYIIYHKITIYSSKTPRLSERCDGFFNVLDKDRDNSFICSYTTFSKLVQRCVKDKLNVKGVFVSNGLGIKSIVEKLDKKGGVL